MVTWVLEREVFADSDQQLADAVIASGGTLIDWRDDWWWDGFLPVLDGPVVFHGSLANADRIARELPWTPGAICATDRFACSAWWPLVPNDLVAAEHLFTTAAELAETGAPPAFGQRVFVRPDGALKPFSGRVLDRDTITLAALDHGFYFDDEYLPVVVTPVIEIAAEWRFVVVEGAVVAGSSYVADGRAAGTALAPSSEVWQRANHLSERLANIDNVFVLDVCSTRDGWRLLELNPFSGADLYACERNDVVVAVHRLVSA